MVPEVKGEGGNWEKNNGEAGRAFFEYRVSSGNLWEAQVPFQINAKPPFHYPQASTKQFIYGQKACLTPDWCNIHFYKKFWHGLQVGFVQHWVQEKLHRWHESSWAVTPMKPCAASMVHISAVISTTKTSSDERSNLAHCKRSLYFTSCQAVVDFGHGIVYNWRVYQSYGLGLYARFLSAIETSNSGTIVLSIFWRYQRRRLRKGFVSARKNKNCTGWSPTTTILLYASVL